MVRAGRGDSSSRGGQRGFCEKEGSISRRRGNVLKEMSTWHRKPERWRDAQEGEAGSRSQRDTYENARTG